MLSPASIDAIVGARHGAPFDVLGPHVEEAKGERALVVRALAPDARRVWVVDPRGQVLAEAQRRHDAGLFEATLDGDGEPPRYRLRIEDGAGAVREVEDPYAFGRQLTEFDLHLLAEGTHYRSWEKLGAHLTKANGIPGVVFAVWAPNAARVSVVGDFNGWDGRLHPMRKHDRTGIWELFIPGIEEGQNYKYEILPSQGGPVLLKADPYAFQVELPPKTASRVYELAGYEWQDQAWLDRRRAGNHLEEPISIYEVHLGSWRHARHSESLSYREAAHELAAYLKEMGFTHVELMPITEHPFYGSWGYQTINFFAPTGRFGSPQDLMAFVDTMHQHGIGVILDWVPAHFPEDPHGLAWFDGTHLYEHADPRMGRHPDWDTLVFNYGRTEVWNFLLSNALFWLEQYHFDGLRVDAVASMLYLDYSRKEGQWIPNRFGGKENLEAIEFIKYFNTLVHREHPGVLTIAEESTSFTGVSRPTYLGGLGFSLKWNMGWMHDVLDFFSKDPVHRKYHANTLTFSMLYAYTENFVLALSHDEVVHGKGALIRKMPGDDWQKRANLRSLLGYMYGHPGKKHLFMGMELGQWDEWWHDKSLDWHLLDYPEHRGLVRWMADLNRAYQTEPALFQRDFGWDGFRWIDCNDADNTVYSFLRFAADPRDFLVFVCNFTPIVRDSYRVGVPEGGYYAELLNSDAEIYGGSNLGNAGGLWAEPTPWHGLGHSVNLKLPPLGVVVLKLRRG
ncbi:MAG TPA: 1,4-alpha-glucan branching protein GlgB [Polyangia bacterium]|jgi:1,4-alpha-glucan branching enzyme